MDLKMIEGIPNWNGPHQQLFLEWAWGFHVNLRAVKRGLSLAAKWACRVDSLDTRISERSLEDFPTGVNMEEASEDLFFILTRKMNGYSKAMTYLTQLKDRDGAPCECGLEAWRVLTKELGKQNWDQLFNRHK